MIGSQSFVAARESRSARAYLKAGSAPTRSTHCRLARVEQRVLLQLLRFLSDDLGIVLICAGAPEAWTTCQAFERAAVAVIASDEERLDLSSLESRAVWRSLSSRPWCERLCQTGKGPRSRCGISLTRWAGLAVRFQPVAPHRCRTRYLRFGLPPCVRSNFPGQSGHFPEQ